MRMTNTVAFGLIVSVTSLQPHKVSALFAESTSSSSEMFCASRYTDSETKILGGIRSRDLGQPWTAQIRLPKRGKADDDRKLRQMRGFEFQLGPLAETLGPLVLAIRPDSSEGIKGIEGREERPV